jgi:anti-sigma-K factor RskA
MNYEHPPERLASLADEYVLGTLGSRARRRFERVLEVSEPARAAVRRAEDRLTALSERLAPVPARPATWDAIVARLELDDAGTLRRPAATRPSSRWRLALAALLAGLALGVGWLVFRDAIPPAADIATLRAEGGPDLWVVATDRGMSRLEVRAASLAVPPAGRAYELWALPAEGAPVSLGLLPSTGAVERKLQPAQRTALVNATKVAVSLEPEGGSPTGAPTGPVLYVASVERVAS